MGLGYKSDQPDRDEVAALAGPVIVQFGTNWCGYCAAAEPHIAAALAGAPAVPVIKVEDGKGLPLGRSFGVKLWPTVVFLRDGVEVARVVRPTSRSAVEDALALLVGGQPSPGN